MGLKQAIKQSPEALAEAAPKAMESLTAKPMSWIAEAIFGTPAFDAQPLDPKAEQARLQTEEARKAELRNRLAAMAGKDKASLQKQNAETAQKSQTTQEEAANKKRMTIVQQQDKDASLKKIQNAQTNLEGGRGRKAA